MNHPTSGDGDAVRYEIRVEGRLHPRWSAWFDGMTVGSRPDGTTVIEAAAVDQAALHGLLRVIRDAGLRLISVTRIDPAIDRIPRRAARASSTGEVDA